MQYYVYMLTNWNNKVLYTKGDANKHMDKEAVNREMLVGKVVKTINSVSWLITKYYELLEGV